MPRSGARVGPRHTLPTVTGIYMEEKGVGQSVEMSLTTLVRVPVRNLQSESCTPHGKKCNYPSLARVRVQGKDEITVP